MTSDLPPKVCWRMAKVQPAWDAVFCVVVPITQREVPEPKPEPEQPRK